MLLIIAILHGVLTPVLLASLCWAVFALAPGVQFSATRALFSSWIALSSALLTIATGMYSCFLYRLRVSSSLRSMIPGLRPAGPGVCFDAMTYVGPIVPIMLGVVIATMAIYSPPRLTQESALQVPLRCLVYATLCIVLLITVAGLMPSFMALYGGVTYAYDDSCARSPWRGLPQQFHHGTLVGGDGVFPGWGPQTNVGDCSHAGAGGHYML